MLKNIDIYKNIFIKCFPKEIEDNVVYIYFYLDENVFSKENYKYDEVSILGETIKLPYRFYFDKKSTNYFLKDIDFTILNCCYSRHYDGKLREFGLKNIIFSKYDFVVPYVFSLIGDYALEILFLIEKEIEQLSLEKYKIFIGENKKYAELTKQRVISYRNCYYRKNYTIFEDYPGYKILKHFDLIL